jgi:multidrug efflux system outer membrane protein
MRSIPFFVLIALVGCKVGPNYHGPERATPVAFSEINGDEPILSASEDLIEWWKIFNDPFLDSLLNETMQGNFDYRAALERIIQARWEYSIQAAQILPEINGDFQAAHFRTSQSFSAASPGGNPVQNLFQAGLNAVWQIDLFGKLRRSANASHLIWEATCEEARGVKISVLSEVVNTYATICAYQSRVDLAVQRVSSAEEMLGLTRAQFDAGLSNEQAVHISSASFESAKADLAFYEIGLKVNIYSLATLVGREPESVIQDFSSTHLIPSAMAIIPVGLPSDLLRRRPDIVQAERNLAAATEQIGVAVAELFPQIALTGSGGTFGSFHSQGANIGFSSDSANKLFSSQSRAWGFGSIISFPVFDFGKRAAGVSVQKSLAEQAYIAYQKTVIRALEEVEQSLVSYFNNEKRVGNLIEQVRAYEKTLVLTTDQFEAGVIDYLQVVQARVNLLSAIQTLTDGQQELATDLVSVYRALGGDW